MAAVRAPNARLTYVETPPASGCRAPSAANVAASGMDSTMSPTHASNDAGPAISAPSAGRPITPVPSTAPKEIAAPCAKDSRPLMPTRYPAGMTCWVGNPGAGPDAYRAYGDDGHVATAGRNPPSVTVDSAEARPSFLV